MKQVIRILVLVAALCGDAFAAKAAFISGSVSARIIDGTNVTIDKYPFALRLYRQTAVDTLPYCGASAIGEFFALTAAHCFDNKAIVAVQLRGGTTYQDAGGTLFDAEYFKIHPSYDIESRDNDAAVVKVTKSFFSDPVIKLIPLQNIEPVASTYCYVVGWGRTTPTGSQSNDLKRASYTLRAPSFCEAYFGNIFTPQMYCASSTQGKTCFGDSGGPLVCGGRQHGIVSFGRAECYPALAEGFAKVPSRSIRRFIRQVSGI